MGALTVDTGDYKAAVRKLNSAERAVKDSLRSRIWKAGKPLADEVIKDGPEGMPSRGGLRDWLRSSKGGLSMTQTRLAIQITKAGGGHDLAAINRGKLRHPVFARSRYSAKDAGAIVKGLQAEAAAQGMKLKGGAAKAKRKVRKAGWTWVSQSVPTDTYDKAFERAADAAMPEIAKVVDDVMRELQ